MQFDFEKTTPFGVGSADVIALLQDVRKFMIATQSNNEDSLRYDEDTGLWHATSKDSIPMLPKPTYTAKLEKTEKGADWVIETGLGIKTMHSWTVESVSDQECNATEKVTCHCSFVTYHALKWKLPSSQAESHKHLQEYFS